MQKRYKNITLLWARHVSLKRHHCHAKQKGEPRKLLLKLSFDMRLAKCQVLLLEQTKTFNCSEDMEGGKPTKQLVETLVLIYPSFPDFSADYELALLHKSPVLTSHLEVKGMTFFWTSVLWTPNHCTLRSAFISWKKTEVFSLFSPIKYSQ